MDNTSAQSQTQTNTPSYQSKSETPINTYTSDMNSQNPTNNPTQYQTFQDQTPTQTQLNPINQTYFANQQQTNAQNTPTDFQTSTAQLQPSEQTPETTNPQTPSPLQKALSAQTYIQGRANDPQPQAHTQPQGYAQSQNPNQSQVYSQQLQDQNHTFSNTQSAPSITTLPPNQLPNAPVYQATTPTQTLITTNPNSSIPQLPPVPPMPPEQTLATIPQPPKPPEKEKPKKRKRRALLSIVLLATIAILGYRGYLHLDERWKEHQDYINENFADSVNMMVSEYEQDNVRGLHDIKDPFEGWDHYSFANLRMRHPIDLSPEYRVRESLACKYSTNSVDFTTNEYRMLQGEYAINGTEEENAAYYRNTIGFTMCYFPNTEGLKLQEFSSAKNTWLPDSKEYDGNLERSKILKNWSKADVDIINWDGNFYEGKVAKAPNARIVFVQNLRTNEIYIFELDLSYHSTKDKSTKEMVSTFSRILTSLK